MAESKQDPFVCYCKYFARQAICFGNVFFSVLLGLGCDVVDPNDPIPPATDTATFLFWESDTEDTFKPSKNETVDTNDTSPPTDTEAQGPGVSDTETTSAGESGNNDDENNANTDGDIDADGDGDTDTDVDTDTDTDTDTDSGGEIDTDTHTNNDETSSEAYIDSETETETDQDSSTDAISDGDTGSDPEIETGIEAVDAVLVHRWRFNGNLKDEVGDNDAAIAGPINSLGGVVTLTSSQVVLDGGDSDKSQYIDLGERLVSPLIDGIAIEVWATQVSLKDWSRIFDLGGDSRNYLFMSWTRGRNPFKTRVEWRYNDTVQRVDQEPERYRLGTEYHIVMVIDPGVAGSTDTTVTWYSAPSSDPDLGVPKGGMTVPWPLGALKDDVCCLGCSSFKSDDVANATFNDVRIWQGPLTAGDLEYLHDLGPDSR